MTQLQRDIIRGLLSGCHIVSIGRHGYRLRDEKFRPVRSFGDRTFMQLKHLLRKHKSTWVVNKNKVRQLHGKCFAKQFYKQLTRKGQLCEPCDVKLIKPWREVST